MGQLLPEGSLRRRIFEFCDRACGWIGYRTFRPLSDICGDVLAYGRRREEGKETVRCKFCLGLCDFLSKYIELDHCIKNKGKA